VYFGLDQNEREIDDAGEMVIGELPTIFVLGRRYVK